MSFDAWTFGIVELPGAMGALKRDCICEICTIIPFSKSSNLLQTLLYLRAPKPNCSATNKQAETIWKPQLKLFNITMTKSAKIWVSSSPNNKILDLTKGEALTDNKCDSKAKISVCKCRKHCGKATNIFSFSLIVFTKLLSQGCSMLGLCCKGFSYPIPTQ